MLGSGQRITGQGPGAIQSEALRAVARSVSGQAGLLLGVFYVPSGAGWEERRGED